MAAWRGGTGKAQSDFGAYIRKLEAELARERYKIPLGYAALFSLGIGVALGGSVNERLQLLMPSWLWILLTFLLVFAYIGNEFLAGWRRAFAALSAHVQCNLMDGGLLERVRLILESDGTADGQHKVRVPQDRRMLAVTQLRYLKVNYFRLCRELRLRPEPEVRNDVPAHQRARIIALLKTLLLMLILYFTATYAFTPNSPSFILLFVFTLAINGWSSIMQSAMLPSAIKQAICNEFGGSK